MQDQIYRRPAKNHPWRINQCAINDWYDDLRKEVIEWGDYLLCCDDDSWPLNIGRFIHASDILETHAPLISWDDFELDELFTDFFETQAADE